MNHVAFDFRLIVQMAQKMLSLHCRMLWPHAIWRSVQFRTRRPARPWWVLWKFALSRNSTGIRFTTRLARSNKC